MSEVFRLILDLSGIAIITGLGGDVLVFYFHPTIGLGLFYVTGAVKAEDFGLSIAPAAGLRPRSGHVSRLRLECQWLRGRTVSKAAS